MDHSSLASILFGFLLFSGNGCLLWNVLAETNDGSVVCLSLKTLEESQRLAERFQPDGILTKDDFRRLLKSASDGFQTSGVFEPREDCITNTSSDFSSLDAEGANCSERVQNCPNSDVIFSRHSDQHGLKYTELSVALQETILSVTDPACFHRHKSDTKRQPTIGEAWGYGIGFIAALVFLISNIGALLTPLMSKNYFQRLLQFLVAMGAGTLTATSLLVLVPESFDVVSCEHISEEYIWKSTTALFSIYVFYMSERLITFFLKSKEAVHLESQISINVEQPSESEKMALNKSPAPDHGHTHFVTPMSQGGGWKKKKIVATVGWIVLIGDVIHKFVDGMAIGAAFTEDIFTGLSIGIAVLCEELPHELSDIAILLHSGMTMKRAIFLNFLSGSVAFIGLIIGILVGENTGASRWILAVAGGLFLYVPLVDMLPDMSRHLDAKMMESHQMGGKMVNREVGFLLLLQGIGFVIGICIIIVVIYFSGQIEVN